VISYLMYVLTDAGNDTKRGLEQIREMSGAQIVDALVGMARTSFDDIERGMKKARGEQ
jgi:hypothetical protein